MGSFSKKRRNPPKDVKKKIKRQTRTYRDIAEDIDKIQGGKQKKGKR
ncbi:MAG: hypothetical protein ACXABY_31870 [Candidatus Thorarchaeota archaeon]|jgi:hypothetical protein